MAEIRNTKTGILVRVVVGYKGKKPIRVSKTFPLRTHQATLDRWAKKTKAVGIPKYIPKNFDALIQEFLKFKQPQISKRTYEDYCDEYRRYICESFTKLEDVTSDDLQDLLNEYLHLSPRSLQVIKLRLSMVLNYAVLKGYLAKSPMTKAVTIPRQRRVKKMEVLSIEQFGILEGALKDDLGLLTLLLTGLRISELLALEPKHIVGNAIRVEQSLESRYGKRIVSPPKTDNSYRTISIPENLAIRLADISDKPFIFPIGYTGYQKRLKKYCQDLGLPRMSLHGLRHSHCTYLLAKGVHALAVSNRLGHGGNAAFTLSRYGHLIPSMESEMMKALENQ